MGAWARVRDWWRGFRDSLPFVPTLMMLGALVVFGLTTYLDTRFAPSFERFAVTSGNALLAFLVFSGSADSAARLLAAIAGTWATIVGVVYSVTLVTIQLSATKYSAQVIPVFERDRLNQIVLGAFVATFAYALLVLKTVRSPDGDASFVPIVGVNLSIVSALVSLALLIAFIGNLTAYIRPTKFVDRYAQRGHDELHRLLAPAALPGYEPTQAREQPPEEGERIRARSDGYVAEIDWPRLRAMATAAAARIERVDVRVSLGQFVTEGDELLRVQGRVDDASRDALRDVVLVAERPDALDPDRVAETLADIGVTGLSGGATDVGVAKSCVRALLGLSAAAIAQRDPGPAFRARGEDRRAVLVVRAQENLHLKVYREVRRILTKSRDEGYWDVAEDFSLHVSLTLRRAAAAERRATWVETLDWFGDVSRTLLSASDDRARHNVLRGLHDALLTLRERGLDAQADEGEAALREAARAEGVDAPAIERAFASRGGRLIG